MHTSVGLGEVVMRVLRIVTGVAVIVMVAGCAGTADDVAVNDASNPVIAQAPPPPPPPPPPMVSPPSPVSSEQVVVSGVRRPGTARADVAGISRASRRPAPGIIGIPPVIVPSDPNREKYDGKEVSPVKMVASEPVSTFSVDVDTGAYANTRRFLTQGQVPPKAAVRTEEMINYFRYDYAKPKDRSQPFSVATDVATTPWNDDTYLMRIGLRGYDLPREDRPPANLVFLMDVSGSMGAPDKLPLVKTALSGLASELGRKDTVSIVVYAGAAGMVLEPTNDTRKIRRALNELRAGGSTAGGAGIQLAYQIAEDNFIKGGVNRVILATDGDFNVGIRDRSALVDMVKEKRDLGITLTTLGFGSGNYNEAMMEQIADHGNGNYSYIDTALEAKKVLGDEMQSTLFTIAKDVKIQVEFNPAIISQYRLVGYENRALREQDFDNDKIDAGDIGAGHQVTAIYEVVPAGKKGWIAPRRYEDKVPEAASRRMAEAAHVKLRYKLPNSDTSKLIDYVVTSRDITNARAPRGDFAFATSVAAFGQLLRGDELMQDFSFDDVKRLAGTQRQPNFWREEFLKLTEVAASLKDTRSGG
ncbi:MAG: VWA domain-containing protein [Erythrobacter sp.]